MMARTHALSGAAAGRAAAPPAAAATGAALEPATILAGAVVTAGAAIMPVIYGPSRAGRHVVQGRLCLLGFSWRTGYLELSTTKGAPGCGCSGC